MLDARTYRTLSDLGVLALRDTMCSASEGTPFYNLCGFGVTAFAGGGLVASDFGDLGESSGRYASGIGFRYRVSKRFSVDFSIDQAVNDAGNGATYIYVGQAF